MAASNLKGRVAVVTGAGRGIGLAIAEAFLAEGMQVCIGDIDVELAQKEAKRLGCHAAYVDVRKRDAFETFLKEAEALLKKPIDVLVNNAGIMPMGAFLDEPVALAEAQIDINFRGVMYGMQLALPRMLSHRRGHIVNIASLAGRFAIPGSAIYSGTKFAVVGMTEAVASEYRDTGVEFTVIMPSKVTTELTSGLDDASWGVPSVSPQQVAASVVEAVRRPRLFVAVPDYLQAAHALYTLLPAGIRDRGRRLLNDTRLLRDMDHSAHANYANRISALAKKADS